MAKLVVSKFGGTSMGDADCMLRSAEVSFRQGSSVVVVSATSGTTNDLIALGKTAETQAWIEAEKILTKIQERHLKVAGDLHAPEESLNLLKTLFEEMSSLAKGIHLLKDCSVKALDTLVSLGERMSSLLFTEAMSQVLKKHKSEKTAQLLDVRTVLRTDDSFGKAKPLTTDVAALAQKNLSFLRDGKKVVCTQGYIGMTEEGNTTTLGRGGSDYSAAILAEGVSADVLEIWTDVAGIATTDPRLCPKAQPISEISFKEASELATFGAKILHPATLLPAIRKNIPVFVGSSFDAQARGTWVRKDVEDHPLIRAMALRKKQVLVTLSTPEMLYAHGFLFQIFKIFNDHKVSIDAITTSEISVSVTLDDSTLLNKKLIVDLSQIADVQVEENLALISLIGNNINHTAGLGEKIFKAISDINVRMICLGASKHNFCFLVSDEQGPEAIRRLHSCFIEAGSEELA
ncbi:lysine-sensitive aspartokinase 3 [Bdellovibrio bacteriovorus]|uniref:lysine-sensitive aspartokinase 3 n=1 Tax=Bdellovibrio bacteriovorus TaxID=959 RepID=UPI0021CEFE7D|nr:lysine-sensitive aspartokinase 3 [Bdellovibrio bacteriovorus]UXR65618.1 lysine-sensitive aspartokinase 3 [Bdellovibrio bacteriovorus]